MCVNQDLLKIFYSPEPIQVFHCRPDDIPTVENFARLHTLRLEVYFPVETFWMETIICSWQDALGEKSSLYLYFHIDHPWEPFDRGYEHMQIYTEETDRPCTGWEDWWEDMGKTLVNVLPTYDPRDHFRGVELRIIFIAEDNKAAARPQYLGANTHGSTMIEYAERLVKRFQEMMNDGDQKGGVEVIPQNVFYPALRQ